MKSQHTIWLLALCLNCQAAITNAYAQQLEWIRQLGTDANDYSLGVSADSLGNVYISGYTPLNLGGIDLDGPDAFLSKYNPSGDLLWTRQLGTNGTDISYGVSADSMGSVYISGSTTGNLANPNAGSHDSFADAFVSKYDASGNLQWTRQLGTTSNDESYGVSADSFGNVYITGYTYGSLGALGQLWDAFLSKFDASGNLLWTRQLGSDAYDYSYGVSTDVLGNVYISGDTLGSLGGPNAGHYDAFISKYDGTGNLQWIRQIGTALQDRSRSVSADSAGNVYISGYTNGSLGGPSPGTVFSYDAFVSKFDASGNLKWIRQLGETTAIDESYGVSADSFGNVYISGRTRSSLGGPNNGDYDAFVSKYDASGDLYWTRNLGTSGADGSFSVFADSLGHVYISGYTSGHLGGLSAGNYDAFVAKFSTIPEPGTLLLATLASVALLLPRARRQTEGTLISTNPR